MIRRTIHYRGRVQGVGFRATVADLARGRAVTGTVRNLPDGRVELVAEGEAADVDALAAAIRRGMGRFIAGEHAEQIVIVRPRHDDFRVTR